MILVGLYAVILIANDLGQDSDRVTCVLTLQRLPYRRRIGIITIGYDGVPLLSGRSTHYYPILSSQL